MRTSKTKMALAWINEAPGRTQYAAAKMFDVSQSAICIALQQQNEAVRLWKMHGDSILSHTDGHLTNGVKKRALRGKILCERGVVGVRHVHKVSNTDRALDLVVRHGMSVSEAARTCDIGAAAIYGAQAREAHMREQIAKVEPASFGRMKKYLSDKPYAGADEFIRYFEVSPEMASYCMKAIATDVRRGLMPKPLSDRDMALREAASLMRMIGGEHGEAMAQAIEAL